MIPPILSHELWYNWVYLPFIMNQSRGMIFIETKVFKAMEWLWGKTGQNIRMKDVKQPKRVKPRILQTKNSDAVKLKLGD